MRIDSANIGMESERTYTQTKERVRSYSVAVNTNDSFSTGAFSNMLNVRPTQAPTKELSLKEQISKLREECLNLIIRLLFPDKKVDVREHTPNALSSNNELSSGGNIIQIGTKDEYFYEETEDTSFQASGIIRCDDGSEIEFGLNLNMSRSFTEYYSEEIDYLEASLTDPLIINFNGNIPEFSDQTISFDIDSDGVEDQISRLIENSGYLALDINEDGIINDGTELFGTKSGDGFKDLAVYDTDKDGFIDEDDEIFNKLRIMTIDENGQQHIYSLKEKDIGAIGLQNASTQFSINDLSTNETRGVVRRTGIFLFEHGGVGTVQQVDLARFQQAIAAYA